MVLTFVFWRKKLQGKCWDIRLTLVPFRKFPMASRVERINPKVLLCSSWSIPSFRSRSGSATSCHENKNKKVKAAVDYSCFKFLILWFRLITAKSPWTGVLQSANWPCVLAFFHVPANKSHARTARKYIKYFPNVASLCMQLPYSSWGLFCDSKQERENQRRGCCIWVRCMNIPLSQLIKKLLITIFSNLWKNKTKQTKVRTLADLTFVAWP